MTRGLLRPTFELKVAEGPPTVCARLRDALASDAERLESRWARGGGHVIIAPAPARRRIWSAWLHVDLRRAPDHAGTLVFARFTPNPALWTGYMLALIALLAIALFAVALTLAQMTLERAPWGWWVLAGTVACAGTLLGGSAWAQRMAALEMTELRDLIERTVAGQSDRA